MYRAELLRAEEGKTPKVVVRMVVDSREDAVRQLLLVFDEEEWVRSLVWGDGAFIRGPRGKFWALKMWSLTGGPKI